MRPEFIQLLILLFVCLLLISLISLRTKTCNLYIYILHIFLLDWSWSINSTLNYVHHFLSYIHLFIAMYTFFRNIMFKFLVHIYIHSLFIHYFCRVHSYCTVILSDSKMKHLQIDFKSLHKDILIFFYKKKRSGVP